MSGEVRRPEHGTNNQVWLTDDLVLRVHHHADAERILAEHRLLEALSHSGLSFEVPAPVPTREGSTLATTDLGLAALYPRLPGDHPPRTTNSLALAGAALAELDAALAELPANLAPIDWRRPLADIHPALTDLDDLAADFHNELPDPELARWFAERAPEIEEEARRYESTLPTQIIHGDFALSNLLVADGRVTGILDFEIAGLDLRAVELAAALLQTSDSAQEIEAFRGGYGTLSPEEEWALPTLILYRALGSAVWRAGHWRTGHSPIDMVSERLALVRDLDKGATPKS